MAKNNVYDDGKMKIEVFGIMAEFIETDAMIASLDMFKRIRILEFISGIRDVSEVEGPEEASLLMRVLSEKLMGRVSPELNPDTWHLPDHNLGRS